MSLRPSLVLLTLTSLLLVGGALGCGDDHDHGDDDHSHDEDGHSHAPGGCGLEENCPDFDLTMLSDSLVVAGDDGVFSVEIVEHNDLSIRSNAWTIKVTDEDGAVAGADVTYGVYSLDCMHPGPTPDVTVSTDASGEADIEPVNAHGGPWETTLTVSEGGRTDTVRIGLCVPGAAHGEEDAGS